MRFVALCGMVTARVVSLRGLLRCAGAFAVRAESHFHRCFAGCLGSLWLGGRRRRLSEGFGNFPLLGFDHFGHACGFVGGS